MNAVILIGKLAGDVEVRQTKNKNNETVDMYTMTIVAETQGATGEECQIKCQAYEPAQVRSMKNAKMGDRYAVTGHLITRKTKVWNEKKHKMEERFFYSVHAEQVEKIID